MKDGGVLFLFCNDSGNVEFTHFNKLAAMFGIQFNYDSKNKVTGRQFGVGRIHIEADNVIFSKATQVYIKEYSSLAIQAPAKPVLVNGDNVAAIAKVGQGMVFALGNPWFYNEYIDGRKIPMDLENYKAAEGLVKWAILQTK